MEVLEQRSEVRIRAVIICFALYVALMLFQTSYLRLGTITAAVTLFLTFLAYFMQEGPRLRFNGQNVFLGLYSILIVAGTVVHGSGASNLVVVVAQMLLCIVLFSVNISEQENEWLKNVFTISSTVYAILIIRSIYENRQKGYIHMDIQIFSTEFDPNFVGIPLVAAMAILLDNVLNGKRRIFSAACYAVLAVAVVYTASRGSFMAALISGMMVLFLFLSKTRKKVFSRLVYMMIPLLGLMLLVRVFEMIFPNEWARMLSVSTETDNSRVILWRTALRDWRTAPFFGNGLGYAYRAHAKASHNTYLQVLSETGLVGAFLFGSFLLSLLRKAMKKDKGIFCALVGVMVQIMFLDALSNRCLWIVLCWIAMLPQKRRNVSGKVYS